MEQQLIDSFGQLLMLIFVSTVTAMVICCVSLFVFTIMGIKTTKEDD